MAIDAPEGAPGKPFFTNRGGRFVADGMAPGRYRLVVRGETLGEFVIPANVEGVIDVGEIKASRPLP
ncbi:hypothetical protein D3C81_2184100 [compost metagenome]